MHSWNGTKRHPGILAVTLLALAVLFYSAIDFFSGFLETTHRVSANILVVEGWMKGYALERAREEFMANGYDYLVTTGDRMPSLYELDQNGYLVLDLRGIRRHDRNRPVHHIGIKARSSLPGRQAAHFNVWFNDSLAGDFMARKKELVYRITWRGHGGLPDSLMVQFNNDKAAYGDRNLYVTGFIIDGYSYEPFSLPAEYDIGRLDGKHREDRNADSYAGLARSRLIDLGIDPSKIIAVPGNVYAGNRTYESVVAFKNWLDSSNLHIRGINILSLGQHARRTWLTYRKVLDHRYDIGIIAIPLRYQRLPWIKQTLFTVRQIVAYVYYRLVLLPVKT